MVEPPVTVADRDLIEGLVQLGDGRVGVTHSPSGVLMFTEALVPLPSDDKSLELGLGFALLNGLAWDADTNQFLVNAVHEDAAGEFGGLRMFAVPPSLDSFTLVADFVADGVFAPGRLTYLPAPDSLAGVANNTSSLSRRGIHLYSGSTRVERVVPSTGEIPTAIEYIPTTAQFAAIVRSDRTKVKLFTRTGAFVGQFDPRPNGVGFLFSLAYFQDPRGNERLLVMMRTSPPGTKLELSAVVTDLAGTFVSQFSIGDELHLFFPNEVTAVTTGPYAGALAIVDINTNEIVVFRLNP